MTSSVNSVPARLRPLPQGKPRAWWLWPQSVSPGFYGKKWSNRLWITTNHWPSVASAARADTLVLAVEAGGLPPMIAAAFDPGVVEDARQRVEELTGLMDIAHVEVDRMLARRLFVESSATQGPAAYQVSSVPAADRTQIGQRLVGAFLLTLGQAVIIGALLLLFGWQNLVAGLGILFSSGLLMSLLWPLPRRKCIACRLVLSLFSTLIAVAVAGLGFGLEPARLAWLAGSWWLSSFWLSFVFLGTRTNS